MNLHYISRDFEIFYQGHPQSRYSIYVYERPGGSCVLSLTYEYWQEAYARQSLGTLVAMSKARLVTVPQSRTNKKSA